MDLSAVKEAPAKVLAWPTPGAGMAHQFPEMKLNTVADRQSVGIVTSGGGSRAYSSTLGVYRALSNLKVPGTSKTMMESIGYISAVSGGSWASTVYTYSQLDVTDEELLGKMVKPEELTMSVLRQGGKSYMGSRPASAAADMSNLVGAAGKNKMDENFWIEAVRKVFFTPQGITKQPFTWNQQTLEELKNRNPSMKDTKFLLAKDDKRPYLIINSIMMGPASEDPVGKARCGGNAWTCSPSTKVKNDFTFINFEVGGYASGTAIVGPPVNAQSLPDAAWHDMPIAGYLESLGLGGLLTSPAGDISANGDEREVIFSGGRNTSAGSLPWAAGTAGSAYGIATSTIFGSEVATPQLWYQSPASSVEANTYNRMAFVDAGTVENIGIMPLLARRVKKLLVMSNTAGEPGTDGFEDAACDLVVLFKDATAAKGCEYYGRNQVFRTEDWKTVYDGILETKKAGNGCVTMKKLTTVENKWYGVPGGHEVEVLFFVLGRATNFEKQLPGYEAGKESWGTGKWNDAKAWLTGKSDRKTHQQMVDKNNGNGVFPNYDTFNSGGIGLKQEEVNLVAALNQWIVEKNKPMFDRLFIDE
jgi:hypothetical protein